ncbi:hypothetical protein ABZ912_22655 [Nonomuraea angiospora]|uniref:hypothetical protein n=1 Tax=Nonomuraea angiospora TaxID=46172 RepID=UPI0033EBD425
MATITVMSQNAQYAARAQGRWPRLAEVVLQVRPTILLLQEDPHVRWGERRRDLNLAQCFQERAERCRGPRRLPVGYVGLT